MKCSKNLVTLRNFYQISEKIYYSSLTNQTQHKETTKKINEELNPKTG